MSVLCSVLNESKTRSEDSLALLSKLFYDGLGISTSTSTFAPASVKRTIKLVESSCRLRQRVKRMFVGFTVLGPVSHSSPTRVYRNLTTNVTSFLPEIGSISTAIESLILANIGYTWKNLKNLVYDEIVKYRQLMSNSKNVMLVTHILVGAILELHLLQCIGSEDVDIAFAYLAVALDQRTSGDQLLSLNLLFENVDISFTDIEDWVERALGETHWQHQTSTPAMYYAQMKRQGGMSDLMSPVSQWDMPAVVPVVAADTLSSSAEDDDVSISQGSIQDSMMDHDHGDSFLFLDAYDSDGEESTDGELTLSPIPIRPILRQKTEQKPNDSLLERSKSMPRLQSHPNPRIPIRLSFSADKLADYSDDECLIDDEPKRNRGLKAFVKEKTLGVVKALGFGRKANAEESKDKTDAAKGSLGNARISSKPGQKSSKVDPTPLATSTPKRNANKKVTFQDEAVSSSGSVIPPVARRSGRLLMLKERENAVEAVKETKEATKDAKANQKASTHKTAVPEAKDKPAAMKKTTKKR